MSDLHLMSCRPDRFIIGHSLGGMIAANGISGLAEQGQRKPVGPS